MANILDFDMKEIASIHRKMEEEQAKRFQVAKEKTKKKIYSSAVCCQIAEKSTRTKSAEAARISASTHFRLLKSKCWQHSRGAPCVWENVQFGAESHKNGVARTTNFHRFRAVQGLYPYRNRISLSPARSWLKRLTRSRSISISILNEWIVSVRYSIHSRSFQQPMRVCCFFLVLLQVHGCFSSQSFWKAGSARKGSQSGSSLRSAGVTGVP